jgi:hypothetical protein
MTMTGSTQSAPHPAARTIPLRGGVVASYVDGWRRVWRAPAVTIGLLLVTWFITPALSTALGSSFYGVFLVEEAAGQNMTQGWVTEVVSQVKGLAFRSELLTFAGLLLLVDGIATASALPPPLLGGLAAYVGIWIFLTGGIVDRLARDRPVRAAAFFAAAGGFVLRLFRLAILAGAAHWALFRWLTPLLRSAPGEPDSVVRNAVVWTIGLASIATVGMIADFAKVRMVVEDRRSAIGSLAASVRFVGRRAGRIVALWLLHLLVVAAIAGAWYSMYSYPSARDWSDVLIVQMYALFLLWAKLALLGAQIAFFQSELAHATYTAAPLPVWPDSPSVEAIENFLSRRDSSPS